MAATIHPSAIVEDGAELGADVRIGPFCHVQSDAVLGEGVQLLSHVSVSGRTTLGEGCIVHPFAVLGGQPQNFRHEGANTTLTIGKGTIIREGATVHVGSSNSTGKTLIGEQCHLFAQCHVAHDCHIGDHVIIGGASALAGHVEIADHASIGGFTAVLQFVRIGHHAFVGGASAVGHDVIPFGLAARDPAVLHGFNLIGMRRAGMKRSDIDTMRSAYAIIYADSGNIAANLDKARDRYGDHPIVAEIVDFLERRGKRPVMRPRREVGEAGSQDDAPLM
ncbi:acyl-[acyl-carrier-protein]--UDP-N-acetylglucosamine O-acyltransferase [Notoacmeibacter marinus]|uniref:Acyl-[acyl-carrier-protein]--UDP-N-acetylglucosamine O-acyltransferase n=1 Tax=Notoacmeibacter marinus TaxID=1876515 RepID=A0A231UW65_9HYPH|nr:acyl-ACP--UDP-N-acetylglucosamine O-acyltransferase [Notoacmeibacter marinus]OXT00183.1 acyl-[acyl-carrier-protein]--UDP-N-acetylglucosamine O-acyltransferase [Notoacmeibacter marinus]